MDLNKEDCVFVDCVHFLLQEECIKVENDEENKTVGPGKWKKNEAVKKTRYYYRSVDDVIEKGKRPGAYRNLGNTR